ncbi:Cryptochrome/photolyase FAD-binding domain-containing protein [Sporormia fimetaria CBS 119925]|uniref:Cryptochrome/photolyase FAD-binding domain-containing protein n=1 Tax=Sporormia fimetaria CBS 119925 TaxID=1340428 RepID=A0A6A6VJ30_9PLEO|nr:Cryptochrome/photolyase FAD-binding domain-containing protein [Sporormia fimetaria CBS 119925]
MFRHDLRVSDHHVLQYLEGAWRHARGTLGDQTPVSHICRPTSDGRCNPATASHIPSFTHFLPIYVSSPDEFDVSYFPRSAAEAPYPPAKAVDKRFWKTGPHRAQFIAEGVWELQQSMLAIGSGLAIRVGNAIDVVKDILDWYPANPLFNAENKVVSIWMTDENSVESVRDQNGVRALAEARGIEFKLWYDQTYFVDERHALASLLPGNPTQYLEDGQQYEPNPPRGRPTRIVPLPLLISSQSPPWGEVYTLEKLKFCLLGPFYDHPVYQKALITYETSLPEIGCRHIGGESKALEQMDRFALQYDFSLLSKNLAVSLSAFLCQGNITAPQIFHYMLDRLSRVSHPPDLRRQLERDLRRTLLLRDAPRLIEIYCRRYNKRGYSGYFRSPAEDTATEETITRFCEGCTGFGPIDASQRQLLTLGFTSFYMRRVNAETCHHLGIASKTGAAWYQSMLLDYDPLIFWADWHFHANGDRSPLVTIPKKWKTSWMAHYIRHWIIEFAGVPYEKLVRSIGNEKALEKMCHAWRFTEAEKNIYFLTGLDWVENSLYKIGPHNLITGQKSSDNSRGFEIANESTQAGPAQESDPDQGTTGGSTELDANEWVNNKFLGNMTLRLRFCGGGLTTSSADTIGLPKLRGEVDVSRGMHLVSQHGILPRNIYGTDSSLPPGITPRNIYSPASDRAPQYVHGFDDTIPGNNYGTGSNRDSTHSHGFPHATCSDQANIVPQNIYHDGNSFIDLNRPLPPGSHGFPRATVSNQANIIPQNIYGDDDGFVDLDRPVPLDSQGFPLATGYSQPNFMPQSIFDVTPQNMHDDDDESVD